jgi:hypothetical protein
MYDFLSKQTNSFTQNRYHICRSIGTFNLTQLGDEKSIKVVVQSTGLFGTAFTSLDPNYKVESQFLGTYSIG